MGILISYVIVFLILFIIPIIVYGLFTRFFGLKEPSKQLKFFIGVVIQKIATTIGFISLFTLAKGTFDSKWLVYGIIWFIMFALTEIGQTFLSGYSKKEALAGIISEAIYFPLAALTLHNLL